MMTNERESGGGLFFLLFAVFAGALLLAVAFGKQPTIPIIPGQTFYAPVLTEPVIHDVTRLNPESPVEIWGD